MQSSDIPVLSFKNLGISSINPPVRPLLSNVSGYIQRGGITAILGASASGKSLLMQVLAGRVQDLHVTGEVLYNGNAIDSKDVKNPICYVPQDDLLIGELSSREMVRNTALMRTNKPSALVEEDVEQLLKDFGLGHVLDNAIGTVFARGLSGGQKKRVDVCAELISQPPIIFLDEPTSGLDGAIAFEVLQAVQSIAKKSKGNLSVMLSIHQPNSRVLELFDNIMLLGGGGMLFFGTVAEAKDHFASIGFPAPPEYTPTDYFLQISDVNFGTNKDFDFEGKFMLSKYSWTLSQYLSKVKRKGLLKEIQTRESYDELSTRSVGDSSKKVTTNNNSRKQGSLWRQYVTLLKRDFILAKRDPSLYYLQFVLASVFGVLVGAAFFRLKIEVGNKMSNISGGVLWLILIVIYMQVFKVYYISTQNKRFMHERANGTFNIAIRWLAELTSTAVMLLIFIPPTAFAYFMMDLPGKVFPFLIFVFWLSALTAETTMNVIAKFSDDTTICIVSAQAFLVILTVFCGGAFIPWDKTPDYWYWLQELSLFTQGSRAAIVGVFDELNFECSWSSPSTGCHGPLGETYVCDAWPAVNNTCGVTGRTVLWVNQGISATNSKWDAFGYLVLIFVVGRLMLLFFMYYPVGRVLFLIREYWDKGAMIDLLTDRISLRRVENQLLALIDETHHTLPRNPNLEPEDLPEREELLRQFQEEEDHVSTGGARDVESGIELVGQKLDGDRVPSPPHPRCRLMWKDFSLTLKSNGKVLVDNVTGMAQCGRVLALMGPSGAGKTTLLNALGNRAPYANVTGTVTYGNRPFTASDLVYVPQFDEMNGNLTVEEQIEFVGLMKCVDVDEMRLRLDFLLRILGLIPKRHQLCQSLTGGELKRISVGMGMISKPNVLFLDEPTTGLDSSAAYSIVNYIVDLAKNTGVAVIMTIHQPSEMVFDMLQDLMLLENGRLAYFGSLPSAKDYFNSFGLACEPGVNPSDFYLDLVSKSPPAPNDTKLWRDLFEASKFSDILSQELTVANPLDMPILPPAPPAPNAFSRFLSLVKFFFVYYGRERGFYQLRIVFLVVLAFFCGTLYLDLKTDSTKLPLYGGAIFFNIWVVLFSAVTATGLLAVDRRISVEQVKNGIVSPGMYCLAQFWVSVPFNLLSSLFFQAVFHWLSNINPDGEAFVYAILITCGHLLLMEALMQCVVGVLKNAMLSVTFSMVLLGSLFLFSGFFIKVKDMPEWIGWICWAMPTKYSFDGYLYQIFHSQEFDAPYGSPVSVFSGDYLLKNVFGQKKLVEPWSMFGTLLAFIALIRFAHYGIFLYEVWPFVSSSSSSLAAKKKAEA